MMRAILCKAYGPPESLVLEEVADPQLAPNGVVIDVHAAGLNFPDVLIVQGKYQVKPPLPFSPGAEVAGIVREVGANVTTVRPGDRVAALTTAGGFAERVAAHTSNVVPIPDAMPFNIAAGFLLTYGTTYHALVDRARLRSGESLLVTGAGGGVGIAAAQIGRVLGARVIAAAGSPEKLEAARRSGATELVNYRDEPLRDRLKTLTGGKGVDVVFDPVGGEIATEALRALGWDGRFLVIGFASGTIPSFAANRVLLNGSAIVGVYWGAFAARDPERSRANFAHLFQLYADGKIAPETTATYPLHDAPRAIAALMQREIVGKAVIEVRPG